MINPENCPACGSSQINPVKGEWFFCRYCKHLWLVQPDPDPEPVQEPDPVQPLPDPDPEPVQEPDPAPAPIAQPAKKPRRKYYCALCGSQNTKLIKKIWIRCSVCGEGIKLDIRKRVLFTKKEQAERTRITQRRAAKTYRERMKERVEREICPVCGYGDVRARLKAPRLLCIRCGNRWDAARPSQTQQCNSAKTTSPASV